MISDLLFLVSKPT